ncbi:uncharacterized protein LOC130897948 [Diorhabda carinulata]|uniref:uncharacterized protein LOC130897948 n=1 Tax=Diorhabda carinulata TaxID=1163345 RepID=UPI0025A181B6|nr:uncharacterized protein LOC130897948 [Diorhabda carinulata]
MSMKLKPIINLKKAVSSTQYLVNVKKVYKNPFFNFLKYFRKTQKGKFDLIETTKKAANIWRLMNVREKSPFLNQSREAKSRTKRRRRSPSFRRYRKRKVIERKGSESSTDSASISSMELLELCGNMSRSKMRKKESKSKKIGDV